MSFGCQSLLVEASGQALLALVSGTAELLLLICLCPCLTLESLKSCQAKRKGLS